MENRRFDEWLWEKAAVKVQYYNEYNEFLTAYMFRKDCDKRSQ